VTDTEREREREREREGVTDVINRLLQKSFLPTSYSADCVLANDKADKGIERRQGKIDDRRTNGGRNILSISDGQRSDSSVAK
jgi:hypothetical protein